MALLTLQNLYKYYTGAQSVVVGLNGLNLSFEAGEFVAVTGESGSGKSTLAHVLGGILPYESGELLLNDQPTSHYDGQDWERYRRDQISFISQSYGILPGSTVLGNVTSALRLAGLEPKAARREAEAILRRVELWELRSRRAARLSSGQKQRLSIARALAKPAPILLADEPTGNLDAENSAKIIALLAEAAKERLVILITHEFSEAEDHVTRHIVLQDGKVAADSRLRPAPAEVQLPARPGKPRRLGPYVAGLQLRSRPVWSVMMLCFFALTAFAVFAFLGTFIVALDDTSTRVYDNSAFRNGDRRRIVVVREDGADMTQSDLDTLLDLSHVVAAERYGYVRDFNYAWREDVDYRLNYDLENIGDNVDIIWTKVSSVLFTNTAVYVQTVPVFADESYRFLKSGRLPESMYEVVAAGDESLLGQTIPVYVQDRKNWSTSSYIYLEVTVVGITDYGSGLYFHDDLGRILTTNILNPNSAVYGPAPDLEDGWFRYVPDMLSRLPHQSGVITIRNFNDDTQPAKVEYHGRQLSTFPGYLEISPGDFDRLMPDTWGDQIALTIEDYAYTDRVLKAVEEAGYVGLSPFRESSTEQNPTLAEQRMQTLRICLLALLAILLLQIFVLRAMFGMETESYRLLSNIGLNCRTAQASVFLQMLCFAVAGQLLGFGVLRLCARLGVERIISILRYLPPVYTALLSGVHLLACVLTALWMMRSLRRQVYPFAAMEPDLKEVS